MYVARVPNRNSPPAYLLREGYREDGKVKSRTLANLTHWPLAKIERLRQVLRDEVLPDGRDGLTMLRSLPHGHVAAVLGAARKLGLERLLAARQAPARLVALVLAMIVARVIDPASKLATARQLDAMTATSSLGALLGLGTVSEQDLYTALDWLLSQQARIEQRLALQHLSHGTLVLYDVTSTYFEGRTCPLARRGYSRDGKRDKLQIIFGLLCASDGCPVAVEVFEGNVADPATLTGQVTKLKQRFHLDRVVLIGDRGMITETRIETLLKPAGLDWITALRAPTIKALLDQGAFQLSLFDERDLAEVTSPAFPDERLVVCRNPLLAGERARKRQDLLAATEADLARVANAVTRQRRPLRGADQIGLAAGAVLNRHKMAKHFTLTITEGHFAFARNQASIDAESQLDGIYVIRTNLAEDHLTATDVVRSYKDLSRAERAFRSLKTVDLEIRPIHHRLPDRVRAHVLLCMLAYYVEWHMRQALAPVLFDDHQRDEAAARTSIVAPAQRSTAARRKAANKITDDGLPVLSFQLLLAELATFTRNTMALASRPQDNFLLYPQPTPIQSRAFDLLGIASRL
ncbi:MAG TPA: IS1634 family transposase [Acetobacteraceae bacterium]|nr:IS1634 family transposase [Acetobacteraceae bacterium]